MPTPCVTIRSACLSSDQPSKIFITAFFKDGPRRRRLEFSVSVADLDVSTLKEEARVEGRLHDLVSHGVREALGSLATRHVRMSWIMPHSKLAELAGLAVDGVEEGPRKTKEFGPPLGAHRFLNWTLPAARSAEIIGDLDEIYFERILPTEKKKWARRWYWLMAVRAVLPLWRRSVWKLIKDLGIVGGVTGTLGWLWEKLSS